jgi:glycerol-3-phosphate acyltransferase PlsY
VPFLSYIVCVALAYLLGSIPTGFLAGQARGIDIRTVGSGNIGATNAFRILGKGPGLAVLLGDALKGWLAVAVAAPLAGRLAPGMCGEALRLTAGVAVILGHNYTCWLRFKGGKGIATSAGVLFGLVPWALMIILGIWIILLLLTRYASVASIVASFALPFATWFTTHPRDLALTGVTAGLAALAIYKHRVNVRRLIDGTEHRIQFKKPEATP